MCAGVAIFRPTSRRASRRARAPGLTTQEISRESTELDWIAKIEPRRMRGVFRPWEKSKSRRKRERTRRCGAGFQVNSTKIARVFRCTNLARELFDRRNAVLDRGAGVKRTIPERRSAWI
jgi:hypothetical protein